MDPDQHARRTHSAPGPRGDSRGGPRGGPRLLDRLRAECRRRHYAYRTEQSYAHWVRRYCRFHRDDAGRPRHPDTLVEADLAAFLSHLAEDRHVAASTQNQALHAVLFLYEHVLDRPLGRVDGVARAKRPKRLPVVLTRAEVDAVLAELRGVYRLIASVLYGSGLRLREGLRLRVHDLDRERGQMLVREGKGGKDRVTVLPSALDEPLDLHLARERARYEAERAEGTAAVSLPGALARKYPNAETEWGWRYVFPAARPSVDPRSGRTVQELLGHRDVKTTEVYTHVLNRGVRGVVSPLDR